MSWLRSFWKALNTPANPGRDAPEHGANLTPRAQQVINLARREAQRLHHSFVGTEHVLLGLIQLGQGTAVTVLEKMGVDLEAARAEVERQVGAGPNEKLRGHVPLTPRVKKVLLLASTNARALHHAYVGTEHILLGLLQEGDGVAYRVLKNLRVDIEKTRLEILKELDPNATPVCASVSIKQRAAPPAPESIPRLFEPRETTDRPKPPLDLVDTSRRYDVHCTEQSREVVYRRALFKGIRRLFPQGQHHTFSDFLELEQADGQTVFVARHSVVKFSPSRDSATQAGAAPLAAPLSPAK